MASETWPDKTLFAVQLKLEKRCAVFIPKETAGGKFTFAELEETETDRARPKARCREARAVFAGRVSPHAPPDCLIAGLTLSGVFGPAWLAMAMFATDAVAPS